MRDRAMAGASLSANTFDMMQPARYISGKHGFQNAHIAYKYIGSWQRPGQVRFCIIALDRMVKALDNTS